MAASHSATSKSRYILYIGTYEKGIYAFDHSVGADPSFAPLGRVGDLENPSFLAADPQHRCLYAVSELEGEKDGGVGAFQIDRKTGKLKKLNTVSSSGVAPCHLAVDHTSKFLAVANYGSGSVSGFHLERDGSIGTLSALAKATGSSINPARQTGPHAHQVVFSANNRFLFVPDLGLDQIRIYEVSAEEGKLTPHNPPAISGKAGLGPRHMAFSPDRKFVYLLNELQSFVTVYQYDEDTVALKRVGEISSLPGNPENRDGAAEILVHPSGKFVYASNRGPGTVAVYKRNSEDGMLSLVETAKVEGTVPRGMEFDPSGAFLLVGDQKQNHFSAMAINADTGELRPAGKSVEVPSPVSFIFIPAA